MNSLLLQLQSFEVELHHPGVRSSRERLEQLLHPEFHEVGRSGRGYTGDTVIAHLLTEESRPAISSDAFAVVELAPGVALLTYRSAHIESGGGLTNHTLRSSIWVKTVAGWQLRYHQGTAASTPW